MSFVHGHPRDTGWVVAHRRRPNHAEDGQLPLLAVAVPDDVVAPDVPEPSRSREADESEVFSGGPA